MHSVSAVSRRRHLWGQEVRELFSGSVLRHRRPVVHFWVLAADAKLLRWRLYEHANRFQELRDMRERLRFTGMQRRYVPLRIGFNRRRVFNNSYLAAKPGMRREQLLISRHLAMKAHPNDDILAQLDGWFTALTTSVCLDDAGKEVVLPVERWLTPPSAPKWAPYYAQVQQLRKRWNAANRPAIRVAGRSPTGSAGREHRSAASSTPAVAEPSAEPPGAPHDSPLSSAEQAALRFFCREAIATWMREN